MGIFMQNQFLTKSILLFFFRVTQRLGRLAFIFYFKSVDTYIKINKFCKTLLLIKLYFTILLLFYMHE